MITNIINRIFNNTATNQQSDDIATPDSKINVDTQNMRYGNIDTPERLADIGEHLRGVSMSSDVIVFKTLQANILEYMIIYGSVELETSLIDHVLRHLQNENVRFSEPSMTLQDKRIHIKYLFSRLGGFNHDETMRDINDRLRR